MAVSITATDVKNGFSTSLPDSEITMLIAIVDDADACLDANAVSENKQKALKIYAVRHMLALQENDGRGKATSESAPSGASRSFASWQGKDLGATRFGSLLKQLDSFGCVTSLLESTARAGIRSIGPRACR